MTKDTLGITHSICETCRDTVPAKIVSDGRDVHFMTFCPRHGESRSFVRSDTANYLETLRYVKPAWVPRQFNGDASAPCPSGCGTCERHEQHLCMPVVEITSRCDLQCPVCLVNAGGGRDMTLDEFRGLLDRLIAAEGQVDVLNLSGGEPLLHTRLLDFVDEALSRKEIVRLSVSTNGLRLLSDDHLIRALKDRNVVISLQFDGFESRAYELLRGAPLLEQKRCILQRLADTGATTSLTMTVAGGVNDHQLGEVLNYFFNQPHIVSLMLQPMAFAGRGADLENQVRRLTIPDITRALGEAGHPAVKGSDFVPLPCSHPLCFSLSFYLMHEDGGASALSRLVDAETFLDTLANRVIFGLDANEHRRMQELIYDLWSGPAGAVPESTQVLQTLRSILREISNKRFDPRQAFTVAERRVKSIFIHAFMDAETFDLARARRCCNAYPQPDGRLLPVCVHNNIHRFKGK